MRKDPDGRKFIADDEGTLIKASVSSDDEDCDLAERISEPRREDSILVDAPRQHGVYSFSDEVERTGDLEVNVRNKSGQEVQVAQDDGDEKKVLDQKPKHVNLAQEDDGKKPGVVQVFTPDDAGLDYQGRLYPSTLDHDSGEGQPASRPGAVRARSMPMQGGGPQYKHQVQNVDHLAQAERTSRDNYYPSGVLTRSPPAGGPDFKQQLREFTPPAPSWSPTCPATLPFASGADLACQDKDGKPSVGLEEDASFQENQEIARSALVIPSASLVPEEDDTSIVQAQAMTMDSIRQSRKVALLAVIVIVALAVGTVAGVCGSGSCSQSSSSQYEYIRPENDVGEEFSSQRGPCPALNTLANHGYINRNGQNINIRSMAEAIEFVFGADADDMMEVILGALRSGVKTAGLAEDGKTPLINLFDLHVLEHDASFVRDDTFFKPYSQFNATLFERLAARAVDGNLTGEQGEAHQRERIIESRRDNPEVNLIEDIGSAMAFQGCLLQYFGDGPVKEVVRVEELKIFLKEEQIPESFVPRQNLGKPATLRNDFAEQESRWFDSVMRALMAPIE